MIRALIISICFSLLVGCNTLSDAQKVEGQGKKVSYQAPFNKTRPCARTVCATCVIFSKGNNKFLYTRK